MAKVIYDGRPEDYDYLAESGYDFRTRDYINRGWDIFKQNAGGFVGFFFLALVMISMVSFIPILGSIVAIGLQYCVYAGIMIVARKISRGEEHSFNDFFSGFDHFQQLIIAGLLVSIFTAVGMIFLLIPGIYLAVAYSMVIPLIVFGKIEGWPAMETSRKVVTKNWWAFFKLFLVLGLGVAVIAGVVGGIAAGLFATENFLAMGIGGLLIAALVLAIMIVAPTFYCIYYAIYEDIFDHDYEEDLIEEIGRDAMDDTNLDAPIE